MLKLSLNELQVIAKNGCNKGMSEYELFIAFSPSDSIKKIIRIQNQ